MKPAIIIAIAFVLLVPMPVFAPSHPEYVGFEKPLIQIMHGIVPEAVKCNEELVLVLKYSDESPACVKSSTADKLVERGWGTVPPPCCKKLHQEPEESTLSQQCSGTARCIAGTVTSVIDGDTIKVDGQSIRFALSSAPELNELDGDAARTFIENLCPVGSTALVDEDDLQTNGSYGRIIGVIYCNGVNLNEELVESKFGYVLSGFCKNSEFAEDAWARTNGC
jgi:endonuclease YncB( thermonuclease family)